MDYLPIAFFVIAFFYSMVGFGGGSSYLVLLVLSGISYQSIPPVALVCNLIVATGGFYHFYRAGHFRPEIAMPFMMLSIPMAYLGGSIVISKQMFCILLGLSLCFVALRLVMTTQTFSEVKAITWKQFWIMGLPLGGAIGFLAGIVGIGGGIFLSPLLIFLRWTHVKQAAAIAALFIVVNSCSGFLGHLQKGMIDLSLIAPLGFAVFLGGQIGARLGANRIPKLRLQQALSVFILLVSIKLMFEGV